MHSGVREEKIQPLLTDELSRYCLGSLENIDMDFVQSVYFQPDLACQRIQEYMGIYSSIRKSTTI